MDLVALFRGARRATRACIAPVAALAVTARVASGGFAPQGPRALDLALTLIACAALVVRTPSRPKAAGETVPPPLDLGAALVLLALTGALVAFSGGSGGPLAALPVVFVAIGVAITAPRAPYLLVPFGVVVEAALHHARYGLDLPTALALRAALVITAGFIHHGMTRVEVARVRAHATRMIADERKRQQEAARSFRLASASASQPAKSDKKGEEVRVRAALEEIHASIVGLLELARRTMKLRTCALYWIDAKGRSLRLVEAATDDADLHEGPLPVGTGTMAGAINLGRPIALSGLRPDHPGLTYYRGAHGVKSFVAVPVVDDGSVRGVLVADRTEDQPFDADEQSTLSAVALQARRLIDNERVFARLERARDDLARLFEAARALGEALTEEQVLEAAATSARGVVEHDLFVLSVYHEPSGEHRVRMVAGDAPESLAGLAFHDNAGIASAALKARQPLPYRAQFDAKTQFVFTRDVPLADMCSVLALPLVVRDRPVGVITLAAHRRNAFPEGARQLLGVLAAHTSVALANAGAVARLEALATTDPMTGHLNKRALEEEFDRRIRAAQRFSRPVSVIVLDIDKFKRVNDTYGHAVGDVVIKGLGAVLTRCRRETDAVGRFGGEEFVVVCEETDTRGAFQLAERIREELGRQVFATEQGPLSVTCSLGIAEFPRDASDRVTLFTRADEALYAAKNGGRNQTRTADGQSSVEDKSQGVREGARKPAVSRRESLRPAPSARGGHPATTTAS
jgi:diguanylate cyclase (GGDEF)-like protein